MSFPAGPSEYVQGLTYEECATLLNVDVNNEALMGEIFDTGALCWFALPRDDRGWVRCHLLLLLLLLLLEVVALFRD